MKTNRNKIGIGMVRVATCKITAVNARNKEKYLESKLHLIIASV